MEPKKDVGSFGGSVGKKNLNVGWASLLGQEIPLDEQSSGCESQKW